MKSFVALAGCLIFALLAGCADMASNRARIAPPDGQNSLVFGKSQFVHNGQIVVFNETTELRRAGIVNRIGRFGTSDDVLNNLAAPGEWSVTAQVADSGYFALQLAPGRYYFVAFDYPQHSTGFESVRSYTTNPGGVKFRHHFIATFEVEPGKATYIGKIEHMVSDLTPGSAWGWGLKISDDSSAANAWLLEHYPEWGKLSTTKMVQMKGID